MKLITSVFVAMFSLFSIVNCNNCQADIFFSYSSFGEGAAASNRTFSNLSIGDNQSVFIWVEEDFRIDTGAFLDISQTQTGVIRFTGSEVFNPDIEVADTAIDSRWEEFGGGSISDSFIDEMHGFSVIEGTGILPSQQTGETFEDRLHDSGSRAFLFGRVDFQVIGTGTTELVMSAGTRLIVDDGNGLSPTFRSAELTAVPEPGSLLLLGISFSSFLLSRRRSFSSSLLQS